MESHSPITQLIRGNQRLEESHQVYSTKGFFLTFQPSNTHGVHALNAGPKCVGVGLLAGS